MEDDIWSEYIDMAMEHTIEYGYSHWFIIEEYISSTITLIHMLYGFDFGDALENHSRDIDIENSVIVRKGQI